MTTDNLAVAIERLAAPLQEMQEEAKRALIAAGKEAIPHLVRALEHSERDIRKNSALCLGALEAVEAAEPLVRMAADDPDPTVRPLVLRALSDISGPSSPPALRRALLEHVTDEDMFTRALACKGLGRVADDESRAALTRALKDPESWVRDAARTALVPSASPAPTSTAAPEQRAPTALVHGRPSATTGLVQDLGSPDLERRARARDELIQGGEASIDALAPVLENPDAPARQGAIETLGEIGTERSMTRLAAAFQSCQDPGMTPVFLHAMARGLTQEGTASAFPRQEVAKLLGDPDYLIRAGAGAALVSADRAGRRQALEAAINDPEDWVQVTICHALCRVVGPQDRRLVPLLRNLLDRLSDEEGQALLLEALHRITRDPQPDDQQLVDVASFFLHSDDPRLRIAAGTLIASVAGEVDAPTATGLLDLLSEGLGPSVDLVKGVERLVLASDPSGVKVLEDLMFGTDLPAAKEAAQALGRLGSRAAVDALVTAANDQDPLATIAAQVLAFRDPRAPVVGKRLPDGKWIRKLQHLCSCGGTLEWESQGEKEELRCQTCKLEHILTANEKLYEADRTPLGHCQCPGCRRKQPLVRRDAALICPVSSLIHVRPFDHLQQNRLLTDLPFGACSCCAEAQPLIRVNEEVVCYRSRQLYRATPHGFTLAAAPAASADGQQSPQEQVDAINQALLDGTIGIGESGVAVPGDRDDDR